ncbi:MAG TPA: translocation/assembly module TamB domain-containing protein [Caulobacteraceae bacterium]|nr:translocation/assembly module TamB domain-containing protein [Caulobacteraceae bacterium]
MATGAGPSAGPQGGPPRRPGAGALRVAGWAAGVLAALAALLAGAALFVDTGAGHRFLAARLEGLRFDGLALSVGRIEGSIYGRMVLRQVTLSDARGVVATSPAVALDWSPAALLHRQVLINNLASPLVLLIRLPELKGGKAGPFRLGYRVRRLAISDLELGPALTGTRRDVSVQASADVRRGLVRVKAQTQTLAAGPRHDIATITLDAEPKANRLQLAAYVSGPTGGVIDRLLKIDAPVGLTVRGRGAWRDWRGRAEGQIGGRSALDVALRARNGRFTATGTAQPGLVFKSLARLARPALRFDVAVAVRGSRVRVDGWVSSDELAVRVADAVDLKRRVLENVRVEASLRLLSALSPKLRGRGVRLSLAAEGPFARPLVDYDLSAETLGYGAVVADNVRAHGRSARLANGAARIPIAVSAARLSGLSKAAGPLLNLTLNGTAAIGPKGAVTGGLQLRSDHLQALVNLHGSQRAHAFTGRVTGAADATAVRRLGLSAALGGAASFGLDFATSATTPLQVSHLQLTAPQLRVTRGRASYAANGQLAAAATAVLPKYGAVQLTLGGTMRTLRAHLSAPSLKLPLPLTNVQADLTGGAAGYRLSGSGRSAYGPITLDAVIASRAGALEVAVRRAQLAGVTLAGDIRRTPQGPFAGLLTVGGDGLNGTLSLSARGSVQAALLKVRATNARLPLARPVTIRGGQIQATLTLYPAAPTVTAEARLEGVQRATLTLATLEGRLSYRNAAGRASLSLSGAGDPPFRLTAAADLGRQGVRIMGQGELAGVPLRLAQPALIRHAQGEWGLAPVTLLTSGGRLTLSGSFDGGLTAAAQLQNVDLRLVRALRPELAISGRVSGKVEFQAPRGRAAAGRAALQINGLTQTRETTVARPVTVNILASLAGAGAEASADFRRGDAVIGRLQAHLDWPANGSLAARLRAAQVNGGIRYNGPAEALVGLAGPRGQQLTGPVAIGIDASGPLQNPQLRGVVHGQGLDYQNGRYATHITGINVDAVLQGARLELVKLTGGTAGGGRVSASGYAELSAANGWPLRLVVKLERAQIAHSDQVGARFTGSLTITNARPSGGLVSGDLTVDNASYQIARRAAAAEAAELRGVHWKGQRVQIASARAAPGAPSRWRLDVRVHAPGQILVNGLGLESEWRADLRVLGSTGEPRVVGSARSVRGTFSFAGHRLTLQSSSITFTGAAPSDPTLDISASTTMSGVTTSVNAAGTASHPEITFSSTPPVPQDQVLSQLLFGGSSAQLSPLQAVQLAASLNALRGGGAGLDVLGKLSRAAGVVNLRIQAPNAKTGQGYAIGAGRYIASNIYVEVLTDARGYTATQIQVALTPALSLLSQISTFGATSGSISYTHRY